MNNPSSIYIVDDLLEEIFLRLPLKPILQSKTLSKPWRSILESKRFVERRVSLQKSRKILAAYNCDCGRQPGLLPESRFKGDEEIVYLHSNTTTRPSMMTCDGLVCVPEQDWINVLNPWTRQLRRFCFGAWSSGYSRAMGFGSDKVTGRCKVVNMEIQSYRDHHVVECSVLDVETGEWWMMTPPSYNMFRPLSHKLSRKSVCVDGSIYWLQHVGSGFKILALDLHKEEFHNVSVPLTRVTQETQIANLENRLTLAVTYTNPEWKLDIWRKDTRWNKAYSISFAGKGVPWEIRRKGFTPVSVSKQGNLVFTDDHKRLFKYYPRKDEIRCLSSDTCVISPFFETLAPLPLKSSTLPFPHPRRTYKCRLSSNEDELGIVDLLITTLVALGMVLFSL
ncbi:F-box domain-containing protein [Hirschfeldia incana]|nr:F-box domain-containing protein [Hirschfeldia incana]